MFRGRGLACSFCRRKAADVGKLVAGPRVLLAGPRVYICDRCVKVVNQIMEQGGGDEPQASRQGFLRRALSGIVRALWLRHPRSSRREAAIP
jgi:hypothetical protein